MDPQLHPTCNAELPAPREGASIIFPYPSLPISKRNVDGYFGLVSFWRPSPEEMQLLLQGGLVQLTVFDGGEVNHPPVRLGVTPSV